MEIPTAVIHRLQSSLRGAAAAPSFSDDAASAPPFPRVADAVAAFDVGASTSASAELRCGRCGAAGGLLRGAKSALCAYCGSPRRREGGECEGGGIAFRDGPAYRWLLGSFGLDGSELVEFDNESTGSNKSKEAPKSGMVISDLLDFKLTCIPENKGTPASFISEEKPSAVHTPNPTGVSADSFFIERKEAIPSITVSPQTHTLVQEKQTTDSKSLESSRSEMHATSIGLMTSQRTNQIEATPAFANWDAEFQSASLVTAAAESAQPDLFKGAPAAESFSFPTSMTAINPIVDAGNKTNVKSAVLEHSEGLASVDGTLVKDNLFNQKVSHPILESSSGIAPENSVPDFASSLNKNSPKRDESQQRDDTGANDDDAFDDWQEFAGGENQGSLSNAGEIKEEHLRRDSSEIKTIDPWPLGSMESLNNVNSDSSDDWQAFATSSGQEGEDLVKPTDGSTSGWEGGSVRLVEETTGNTELEHPSQATSVDLWSTANVDKHHPTKMVKETNDSFDDWHDFATSGQMQDTSLSQTGDMMEALTVSQKEMNLDSWFMGDSRETGNTDLVNGNNAMLNGLQGFTSSDQSQQNSSKNHSFEHHEATDSLWVYGSSKDAANTSSTNMDSDGFDIWQDFAKSDQVTVVSPEPAKEIDAMDFWLTGNFKESNNNREVVRRIDDSSDGWQDFASFGHAQESTKIPEEGQLVKDPLGTETLNLWASSSAAEKKLEVSGNNDIFDEWQGFKNSGEISLQVSSDASSLNRSLASKPDAVVSLEFETIPGLVSSRNQKGENESSRVAKAIPFDEDLKSMNGMQQMGDVSSLSAIWPTKDAISKPEPADANVGKLLSQMNDLSFMLKDELSIPDKPLDHSKS